MRFTENIHRERLCFPSNRRTKKMTRISGVALSLGCLWGTMMSLTEFSANCETRTAVRQVALEGQSSGGVLSFSLAPTVGAYPYVLITNKPGDAAASVLNRIAVQLSNCLACSQIYNTPTPVREIKGNRMTLGGPRSWIFGGTEAGFKIPKAPIAVSASHDPANDTVRIEWRNPTTRYDRIRIVYYGETLQVLPGQVTHYIHRRNEFNDSGFSSSDIVVVLIGENGDTPSNGAGVRLRRQVQQESVMNVPFSQGIAPGFQEWTKNHPGGGITFEQGNLPGMLPETRIERFNGKGFYQVLKGRKTFTGGVSRRFLGLSSGHTYRVGARLNTLESKEGKWAFTFHAAYNPASGTDLTSAQMAGDEALPNGTNGKNAGQIARYDSTATTDGKWVERFSNNQSPDNPSGDITIPAGSNSVTIWFRLDGKDTSEVAVGLDSVTIEDLGEKK